MNKVVLIGRLTKDPDVRYTQSEEPVAIARFTVAVDRRYKKANEQQNADFINCIAFKQQGAFVGKYFVKGSKIAVVGHIQTGSYKNKDGATVFTTDVVVDEVDFVESKASAQANAQVNAQASKPAQAAPNDFINIPEGIMEELPFV